MLTIWPEERRNGVNFGLSLSCWDYIFGTNYIPHSGRDIPLGFPGKETFPEDFVHQITYLGGQKPNPKDHTVLDS